MIRNGLAWTILCLLTSSALFLLGHICRMPYFHNLGVLAVCFTGNLLGALGNAAFTYCEAQDARRDAKAEDTPQVWV